MNTLFVVQAEETGLKIHYTFNNVTNKTVHDASSSGVDATMVNNATILPMGKYNVLNLGNGTGYLNMGLQAGSIISSLSNYSISVYYRVDKDASLSGAGYFLWAFSALEANSSTAGPYAAYRLNAQRFAHSTGGFSNEVGIEKGGQATKGTWQHVLYNQTGKIGRLYIDGVLAGTSATMPPLNTIFTSAPAYNWIGRAPFSGDNFLKNTLVYDFRVYDHIISNDGIAEFVTLLEDLNYEYLYGTVGNFTQLNALVNQYKTFLTTLQPDNYPAMAVTEFSDAMLSAQELIDEQRASQSLIDEKLDVLKQAYTKLKTTEGFKFEPNPVIEYNLNKGFKHPGGLHTQEDFDRVKRLLAENDPTTVAAYNALKSNEFSQSGANTYPVEIIVRGGGVGENYINAARGACIAYYNALRWKISGDKAHADRAVSTLNAWANVCRLVGGDSNYALASGIYGYEFAQAAELMRDYEGWKLEDFNKFKRWMLDVWYPPCIGFLRGRNGTWEQGRPGHYWSNWGLCNTMALITMGILCDDVYIYNQGVSFYKYDQVGNFTENKTPPIINDGLTEFIGNLVPAVHQDSRGPFGYLGQMQESGRDQGHTLMAVGLAADVCQVGWNQGDDMFSLMDNRLAKGIEYVAAYNTGVDDLPWSEYWYHDVRTAIHNAWKMTGNNGGGRGQFRPYWDRVIAHYEGIKGIQMPYSKEMRKKQPIDFGAGGSTSGGYDHMGFSTLMCPLPPVEPDKVPTLIIPSMKYNGKTYNKQSELGGTTNTYRPSSSTLIPAGSAIEFIPSLPDGVTDTGNWKWSTGETTKNLSIIADKSQLYRVTYTNEKNVESTQLFSVAVKGDCQPGKLIPAIKIDGQTINDTVITVLKGSSFTISAWGMNGQDYWGTYKWNNGNTTGSIDVNGIQTDRQYSVIYASHGGAETLLNFYIHVEFMIPTISVAGADPLRTNQVVVKKGQSVELIPTVSPGKEHGTWKWSTGELTKNLSVSNVQQSGNYEVTYTLNDQEYVQKYYVYIPSTSVSLSDVEYYIKDVRDGKYLTNSQGSTRPTFQEQDKENETSQIWNITKDVARYKITSVLDNRFINEQGEFSTNEYNVNRDAYTLFGVENGDVYLIRNSATAGLAYWTINIDGTINGKGSTAQPDFNFELIPTSRTSTRDITQNKISVFPNPVTSYIQINIEDYNALVMQFSIMTIDGKIINTVPCYSGTNTFHVENLAKGIYFGVLKVDNQKQLIRFIKD